jgi:hypothetical protein
MVIAKALGSDSLSELSSAFEMAIALEILSDNATAPELAPSSVLASALQLVLAMVPPSARVWEHGWVLGLVIESGPPSVCVSEALSALRSAVSSASELAQCSASVSALDLETWWDPLSAPWSEHASAQELVTRSVLGSGLYSEMTSALGWETLSGRLSVLRSGLASVQESALGLARLSAGWLAPWKVPSLARRTEHGMAPQLVTEWVPALAQMSAYAFARTYYTATV